MMRRAPRFLLALLAVAPLASIPCARADDVDECLSSADRAQALRRKASLVAARDQLRTCARDVCPKLVRADCQRWLGEVGAAIPSIVVRVVDASGVPVIDARVTLDGQPIALDGHATEVDPGEHVAHADGPGGATAESRASVQSGERAHPILVTLPTPTPTHAPTPAPAPAPTPSPTAPAPPDTPSSHHVPAAAWILGGVGVVAFAGAAYFWATGLGDRSSLYSGCGATQACAQSDVDSSRTKLVVGDVSAAVGVLALGAATWLTLSSWGHAPQATTAVSVVPGGAYAVFRRTF
ncbi:MAG TPA: hypothetical protein VIF15_18010 [Polyangiaceae bacterium]|jgi:hypothetical protein